MCRRCWECSAATAITRHQPAEIVIIVESQQQCPGKAPCHKIDAFCRSGKAYSFRHEALRTYRIIWPLKLCSCDYLPQRFAVNYQAYTLSETVINRTTGTMRTAFALVLLAAAAAVVVGQSALTAFLYE